MISGGFSAMLQKKVKREPWMQNKKIEWLHAHFWRKGNFITKVWVLWANDDAQPFWSVRKIIWRQTFGEPIDLHKLLSRTALACSRKWWLLRMRSGIALPIPENKTSDRKMKQITSRVTSHIWACNNEKQSIGISLQQFEIFLEVFPSELATMRKKCVGYNWKTMRSKVS